MSHVRPLVVRVAWRSIFLLLALTTATIPGAVLAKEVAHVNAATAQDAPEQQSTSTVAPAHRREAGTQSFRRETPDAYSLSGWLQRAVGRRPGAVRGDDNRVGVDYRSTFDQTGRFFGPGPEATAGIRVTWGGPDRTVSFQYALYQPGDAICCPTGGGTMSSVEVGVIAPPQAEAGEAKEGGALKVSTDQR
jgi:hypothetical protein